MQNNYSTLFEQQNVIPTWIGQIKKNSDWPVTVIDDISSIYHSSCKNLPISSIFTRWCRLKTQSTCGNSVRGVCLLLSFGTVFQSHSDLPVGKVSVQNEDYAEECFVRRKYMAVDFRIHRNLSANQLSEYEKKVDLRRMVDCFVHRNLSTYLLLGVVEAVFSLKGISHFACLGEQSGHDLLGC